MTDRKLGYGSYATVLELEYMGLKCAGKKIREQLLWEEDDDEISNDVHRFEEECRLLRQVRHPNIVQFLGVYFHKESVRAPILVMEFLPTNLTSCIELYGVLPKEVSYSILHDVALGLCYLHGQTPPIIHQDLSSNNVLLTKNMTAKISDLGLAKIVGRRHTQTCGIRTYMPPEMLTGDPICDTSMDVFSYGILMIHTFSGRWPEPQIGPTQYDAVTKTLTAYSEGERRKVFLGGDHPLMNVMCECIDNDPQLRPQMSKIVRHVADSPLAFKLLELFKKGASKILVESVMQRFRDALGHHCIIAKLSEVRTRTVKVEKELQSIEQEIAAINLRMDKKLTLSMETTEVSIPQLSVDH